MNEPSKISPGVQPRPEELEKAFNNFSDALLRYAKAYPMSHICDRASLRDYLAMGYTLQEGNPHWWLYNGNAPHATVDAALARMVTDEIQRNHPHRSDR